jgi:hypothetical protein
LLGALRGVADCADSSYERFVHEVMKLAGLFLAFGGAVVLRELEVLGSLFVLATLSGLKKAQHCSLGCISTFGIG